METDVKLVGFKGDQGTFESHKIGVELTAIVLREMVVVMAIDGPRSDVEQVYVVRRLRNSRRPSCFSRRTIAGIWRGVRPGHGIE